MRKVGRELPEEDLRNDPSLRWVDYHYTEIVWSDDLGKEMRFLRYEGENVRLAELNSIGEVPGLFHKHRIRRPTVMDWYCTKRT